MRGGSSSVDNYWYVGRGAYNVGQNNFVIGSNMIAPISNGVTQAYVGFQINTDRTAYFTGKVHALDRLEVRGNFDVLNNAYITTLQVNQDTYFVGNVFFGGIDINWIYQKRPWVAGIVNDNGTIISTSGRYPFAITKLTQLSGGYNITWNANPMPNMNYVIHAQRWGSSVFGSLNQAVISASSASVYTGNRFGDPIDTAFSFFYIFNILKYYTNNTLKNYT